MYIGWARNCPALVWCTSSLESRAYFAASRAWFVPVSHREETILYGDAFPVRRARLPLSAWVSPQVTPPAQSQRDSAVLGVEILGENGGSTIQREDFSVFPWHEGDRSPVMATTGSQEIFTPACSVKSKKTFDARWRCRGRSIAFATSRPFIFCVCTTAVRLE